MGRRKGKRLKKENLSLHKEGKLGRQTDSCLITLKIGFLIWWKKSTTVLTDSEKSNYFPQTEVIFYCELWFGDGGQSKGLVCELSR